jgi:hypothetical protein
VFKRGPERPRRRKPAPGKITRISARLLPIGLHALAALFHGLVRRDGVLETMLPIRRSAPTRTSADADPAGCFDAAPD